MFSSLADYVGSRSLMPNPQLSAIMTAVRHLCEAVQKDTGVAGNVCPAVLTTMDISLCLVCGWCQFYSWAESNGIINHGTVCVVLYRVPASPVYDICTHQRHSWLCTVPWTAPYSSERQRERTAGNNINVVIATEKQSITFKGGLLYFAKRNEMKRNEITAVTSLGIQVLGPKSTAKAM